MSAPFLNELVSFGKSLSVKREVPNDILKYVVQSDALAGFPLFVLAIIKSAMACHSKILVGDKVKLYSAQEIRDAAQQVEPLTTINQMQVDARFPGGVIGA